MLTVFEWCSRRSRIAEAMTGLPNTSPHDRDVADLSEDEQIVRQQKAMHAGMIQMHGQMMKPVDGPR